VLFHSVAAEGKEILSRYIADKQSGSEVAVRKGQYATSFPRQARIFFFLSSHGEREIY